MPFRTRKRKRTDATPIIIAPKWTKEKLVPELQKCGITVPDFFGLQTLLKLYNENKNQPGLNNSHVTSDTNNVRADPSQNNQMSENSQTALLLPNIWSDLDINAASIVNPNSQRRLANSSSLDSQQYCKFQTFDLLLIQMPFSPIVTGNLYLLNKMFQF